MKKVLLTAALILGATGLGALRAHAAIDVIEALNAAGDCRGVDVSTFTPTALLPNTSKTDAGSAVIISTDNYRFAFIQNVDTTVAIFCRPGNGLAVPTISTSVATGQPYRGVRIPHDSDLYMSLVPGRIPYCMSQAAAASVAATVCFGR